MTTQGAGLMAEIAHQIRQSLVKLLALGAFNYGAIAVSLGINVILTRRLGVDLFGRLALLLTASQVLLLITANWTQVGAVRFGAQEYSRTRTVAETFWTRIWLVAPLGGVAIGMLVVARTWVASYLGIPAWGLLIISAHFLASFTLSACGATFQARDEMQRYGALLFLDKAVMALMVIATAWLWALTPLTVLGMYAVSSSAVAIWALITIGRPSLTPFGFNRQAYRHMLAFSLPLILSSWIGLFGTTWLDYLVLRRYRSFADIGTYSLATVLAGVVQQVTVIFSTLLLPQLSTMVARGEFENIEKLVERILPYWFLGTSVLFSAVVLAGGIVPLTFGQQFARAVPVLAVLMLATSALGIYSVFSALMTALGSTWMLTGIQCVTGAINVIMDLVLIPRYGTLGAAAATVLAYEAAAILTLAFARSRLSTRVSGLALFGLPVVSVYLCFVFFDGLSLYLLAIPAGALTSYWLVRKFGLFSGRDLLCLRDLALLPTGPDVALAGEGKAK